MTFKLESSADEVLLNTNLITLREAVMEKRKQDPEAVVQ